MNKNIIISSNQNFANRNKKTSDWACREKIEIIDSWVKGDKISMRDVLREMCNKEINKEYFFYIVHKGYVGLLKETLRNNIFSVTQETLISDDSKKPNTTINLCLDKSLWPEKTIKKLWDIYNIESIERRVALHYGVLSGNPEMVEFLLEHANGFSDQLIEKDMFSATPYALAKICEEVYNKSEKKEVYENIKTIVENAMKMKNLPLNYMPSSKNQALIRSDIKKGYKFDNYTKFNDPYEFTNIYDYELSKLTKIRGNEGRRLSDSIRAANYDEFKDLMEEIKQIENFKGFAFVEEEFGTNFLQTLMYKLNHTISMLNQLDEVSTEGSLFEKEILEKDTNDLLEMFGEKGLAKEILEANKKELIDMLDDLTKIEILYKGPTSISKIFRENNIFVAIRKLISELIERMTKRVGRINLSQVDVDGKTLLDTMAETINIARSEDVRQKLIEKCKEFMNMGARMSKEASKTAIESAERIVVEVEPRIIEVSPRQRIEFNPSVRPENGQGRGLELGA